MTMACVRPAPRPASAAAPATRPATRPVVAPVLRLVDLAAERDGGYDAERPAPTNPGGGPDTPDATTLVGRLSELARPAALDVLDEAGLRATVVAAGRLQSVASALLAGATSRLERAGVIEADGASSTAQWIASQTGSSRSEASRTARLAGQLDQMPSTARKLAAGDMSPASATQLADAAADGRLGDARSVDARFADAATRQAPERTRRRLRREQQLSDAAAISRDEREAFRRRRVTVSSRDDGMVLVSGQLDPTAGQRLVTVLDVLNPPDPTDTPSDELRSRPQRLADALDELCRRTLARGDAGQQVGGRVPQLHVMVDLSTLAADLSRADGSAPAPTDPVWQDLPAGLTQWGLQFSPQRVREMACDASITRIVFDGRSRPLDVGRSTRVWPRWIRDAAAARDQGCRGPDCDRPLPWTELHHLKWWRDGGVTSLDNALSLCSRCHHLVHDHGWTAELDVDVGEVTWTSPTGRQVIDRAPRDTDHPTPA